MDFQYAPYYCEENVYLMATQVSGNMAISIPGTLGSDREPVQVLFITNEARSCELMHQKAAAPGWSVFWDYHVVAATGTGERAIIWDLDTRLGLPCNATEYLDMTFPVDAPKEHRPLFRTIDAVKTCRIFRAIGGTCAQRMVCGSSLPRNGSHCVAPMQRRNTSCSLCSI
jgi:hypothetical protein